MMRATSRTLHIAFLDLTKVFDVVSREALYILQKLESSLALLNLVR